MKPLVITVITVVFNDASHIEPTMLSVLNQSYSNIEYIVIDGGSTDGTVDIIKKYADRLAYWVSEPDGGIYPAMNKGLEHATGEWVNFMNSGDTFVDVDVIKDIFQNEEYSPDVQVIGGHIINHHSGDSSIHKALSPSFIPSGLPICHQASFTRARLVGLNTFRFNLKYKYAADYALFYLIYYQCNREKAFRFVDRIIANCVQDGSTTNTHLRQIKKEYLAIQAAHPNMKWFREVMKYYVHL